MSTAREVVPIYPINTDLTTPSPRRAIVTRSQVQVSPLYKWGTAAGAVLGPGNTYATPAPPSSPAPAPGTGSSSSSDCGCGG